MLKQEHMQILLRKNVFTDQSSEKNKVSCDYLIVKINLLE